MRGVGGVVAALGEHAEPMTGSFPVIGAEFKELVDRPELTIVREGYSYSGVYVPLEGVEDIDLEDEAERLGLRIVSAEWTGMGLELTLEKKGA